MPTFEELLQISAEVHRHLCPRQVLGVRMGLLGGRLLGLDVPQTDKRIFTIVETDGCGLDGIAVATGCNVGRRTMRVLDWGKTAATMVDSKTGQAVRIIPHPKVRDTAPEYAPDAKNRWESYLLGYQRMPDEVLLTAQKVELTFSLKQWLSRAGVRVDCQVCGEEIINEREVIQNGFILCRGCAGEQYFQSVGVLQYELPSIDVRHLANSTNGSGQARITSVNVGLNGRS